MCVYVIFCTRYSHCHQLLFFTRLCFLQSTLAVGEGGDSVSAAREVDDDSEGAAGSGVHRAAPEGQSLSNCTVVFIY